MQADSERTGGKTEGRREGFVLRPPGVLEKYVLSEISGTMIVAFVLVMGLSFLVLSMEVSRRIGLDSTAVLFLLPVAVPFGLKYALPMSLLLAASFAFSRMAADNEITAVRAAGMTLRPLIAPAVVTALALSGVLLAVTLVWLPYAMQQKHKLFREAGLAVLKNLPRGEQSLQFGAVSIHYSDAADGVLTGVAITEISREGLVHKIMAPEGRLQFDREHLGVRVELSDSQWTWYRPRNRGEQKFCPGKAVFRIDLENIRSDLSLRPDEMNFSQLLGKLDAAEGLPAACRGAFTWKHDSLEYEIHSRMSESFSPLVMVLLGIPLGLMFKAKGKLAAFFASFLPVVTIYYPLMMAGTGLGIEGNIPPALAAWAPDIIVGGIGAVLTWRAAGR